MHAGRKKCGEAKQKTGSKGLAARKKIQITRKYGQSINYRSRSRGKEKPIGEGLFEHGNNDCGQGNPDLSNYVGPSQQASFTLQRLVHPAHQTLDAKADVHYKQADDMRPGGDMDVDALVRLLDYAHAADAGLEIPAGSKGCRPAPTAAHLRQYYSSADKIWGP
jgi:hypothetical protein